MTTQLDYTVIDAFTGTAFRGNPASIIVLEDGRTLKDEQMQIIAREFNLSETAFLVPLPASDGVDDKSTANFGLRWFTPKVEIALCGHATLASAHALFSSRKLVPKDVTTLAFKTLSGILTAKKIVGENGDEKVELEFPAGIPVEVAGNALFEKVVGLVSQVTGGKAKVLYVGIGDPSNSSFKDTVLVELDDSFDLENATIDSGPFIDLKPDYRGVLFTTRSKDSRSTFVTRVFGPALGIPEDPVTGSAHCILGPYWKNRLGLESGAVLKSRQVSERGGEMDVQWDEQKGTCKLRGNATTVAKGVLFPPF